MSQIVNPVSHSPIWTFFRHLLRADGVSVVETTLRYEDFQNADEIFSSGNFASWRRLSASMSDSFRSGRSSPAHAACIGSFAHGMKRAA